MIFNELYSVYYNAVAGILTEVLQNLPDEKGLQEIVLRHAFSESALTILPALKTGKWQLLHPDRTTPIKHRPTMPMTLLEKRWLKAILLDPRILLFETTPVDLEGIEPLFTPRDFVIYDQYSDGDPYFDDGYIQRFRLILRSISEKQPLTIGMINRKGHPIRMHVLPQRLEYSEKDDKFRLISAGTNFDGLINLGRILTCQPCLEPISFTGSEFRPALETVLLRLKNERNALERYMLHFAHFEKQAERLDRYHYLLRVRYDPRDETEMVIRILSFGPMLEVIEPAPFRQLIIDRLRLQQDCGPMKTT